MRQLECSQEQLVSKLTAQKQNPLRKILVTKNRKCTKNKNKTIVKGAYMVVFNFMNRKQSSAEFTRY